MRIPLVRRLGWALFATLVVGLAVALYHFLPPVPRWRVHLEEGERVFVVEPVHGRIFTQGKEGLAALDLCTGRRLGLVVAGKGFTYSNQDTFSPDHRYLAVCFDNGRQVAVVDVVTLKANQIDLLVPEDTDRNKILHFSPDSEWLTARVDEKNGHPARSVIAETATGKVLLRTKSGTTFCGFVPQSNRVQCFTGTWNSRQYAVSAWDLGSGKKVHESPPFFTDTGDSSRLFDGCLRAWSADGRTLIGCRETAAGTRELVAWDLLNNRLRTRVPAEVSADAIGAAVSADGTLLMLATAPDAKRIVFFDLTTGTVRKEHRLAASARRIWVDADSTLARCDTEDGYLEFRANDGELVRHTPAGTDHWYATPNPAITYRLTYDGQMGYWVLDNEFTFHFRDSRTGRVVATIPQDTAGCWPPKHQFGRRLLFVQTRVAPEPGPTEYLRPWLPLGDWQADQIHCIDLATGGEVGRVAFADRPHFHFAETHGLLATWHQEPDSREVACWDVPLRPAWAWVLGLPLGLVALALALALAPVGWRSLRRRTAQP